MDILFKENLHKKLLKEFNIDYSNQNDLLLVDLITVMGSIYCLDVLIKARKTGLNVEIPVINLGYWEPLKETVEKLLKWVSDEDFKITFVKFSSELESDLILNLNSPNYRIVSLFSGGLDSLTGAYFNDVNKIESDYVGFINKKEEGAKQKILRQFYYSRIQPIPEIFLIEKPISKKEHLVQSTRSLLYFSLAVAKAYYNNSGSVHLYENGILSLNPTLKNRFTTKTTHPKTIYEFNNLLKDLNIDIKVKHPFIFKTKGENIQQMNRNFKDVIKDTFTCGAGRSSSLTKHTGQCGVCIPCILRKISMAAYDNEEYDCKYFFDYNHVLKDLQLDYYKKEYISNLQYFEIYIQKIKDKSIFSEIVIKQRYYEETNFMESSLIMFDKFVYEFERYKQKYDANRYSYTH